MEKLENTTNFNEVPKAHHIQQMNRLPIKHYKESYFNRDESIYHAYQSGHYTMKEIGEFFGLHYSRVSKIIYRIGMAKGKN